MDFNFPFPYNYWLANGNLYMHNNGPNVNVNGFQTPVLRGAFVNHAAYPPGIVQFDSGQNFPGNWNFPFGTGFPRYGSIPGQGVVGDLSNIPNV